MTDRTLRLEDLLNQKVEISDLMITPADYKHISEKISDASMKIVHLCSMDFSGAGNAAYRLHKGLLAIGADSTMLVLNKRSGDLSVKLILTDSPDKSSCCVEDSPEKETNWRNIFVKWHSLLSQYPERPIGSELFSDASSDMNLESVKEIRDADIINFHWVAGLIDYQKIAHIFRDKTIIWTLHDMNPFTGGCHYAGDCQKYQKSCGACYQLGSSMEDDLSKQIWTRKFNAYKNLNLNIVTPSKWLAECASKSSLFSKYPVKAIPNSLPLDVFKPYQKNEIRKELGISENAKIILFGADDISNKRKGLSYLLETLNNYSPAQPSSEIILAIFGGNIDLNLKYPIINLGRIAGEDQMALIYSLADLFVIPSLEDNLPNTVIEAMACGIPVVGFNIGGIPDMVEHQKTGYLAAPCDTQGLIDGINWCLFHSNYEQLRFNCREKALNEYGLEIQAKAYKELYENVFRRSENIKPGSERVVLEEATSRIVENPDISIVLATKNRAALLDQMLASLREAAQGVRYELIVIEGNSTDNTLEILQKHGVQHIYNESEHLGQGKHSWAQLYNFGFSKAKGKWAMYASDDTVFHEACITRGVEILNQQPQEVAGGIFFYKNVAGSEGWEFHGIDFMFGHTLLLNYGLVRLDLFREVGGLHEDFRFYHADSDFCLKLYSRGKQFIPLARCLITHNNILDVHKKEHSETERQDMHLYMNRWRHYVPIVDSFPKRLLWEESFELGFTLPSHLSPLDAGISYFWHGLACYQSRNFSKAILRFNQFMKTSGRHWIALWYLANAFFQKGETQKALQTLQEIIDAAPFFQPAAKLLEQINETVGKTTAEGNILESSRIDWPFLVLIFSKDRPLQLDATLRSFLMNCADNASTRIIVFYTSTDPLNTRHYEELQKEYQKYQLIYFFQFLPEMEFKLQVLTILEQFNYVLFLSDDTIFIRNFNLKEAADSLKNNEDALGFSLRLGKNTTYCYPLDSEQRLPEFQVV
ncbi:MAG: glycosyltransferase, partial [Nitrospira sp.]|nr:glycosyltransferase [Nitrospira sp.]